jgi:hypothetical protein
MPRVSDRLLYLLPIVVALGIGCASMQEEYVRAMGRISDAKSNTRYMDKVDADGRYTIRGAANSVATPNLPSFDAGLRCPRRGEQGRSYSFWIKFPVRTYLQFQDRAAISAY